MNFLIALVLSVIILVVIALVLIHNHNSLDAAAAKVDALAIKVDPVIRAGEAEVKALDAQAQARLAPDASVTGQITPGAVTVSVSADVAGSQPAAAPVQAQ